MFIKVGVFLFILYVAVAQKESNDWDLAVAINDQVELLYSNGSAVGSAAQQFSKLKALTFDNIRHQFVVSDTDQENDTIYSVHLTKETEVTPIVQDLPDDVQGLAIDPITDTLYWTDTNTRTINYVSLKDSPHRSRVLLKFDDEKPQDIAIDVCQRYIYWTNSDRTNPTIERATLDGQNHEILINDSIRMPAGIAVDQIAQKIVWVDTEGIYYRIESASFDGSDREILFQGTHQKPFGIAVTKEAVYWTDVNNNALWRKKENEVPEKLRNFKESPMGLVTKHMNIRNISECTAYMDILENYNGSSTEYFDMATDENEIFECLNGGELIENGCKCRRGFSGSRCETSLCYNFCLHGNCHLSSLGYPTCHCPVGFIGTRCEKNNCDGFCLNEGRCLRSRNNSMGVNCECKEGFVGQRCERSLNPTELCSVYCRGRQSDILFNKGNTFICRCDEGSYTMLEHAEGLTAYAQESSSTSFVNHFQDKAFVIQSICSLIMLVLIIALAVVICRLRRRPRIKKRIIVNKNITPLTYRPQPNSQQCEITIENCCNMNVCETPCFDPPQLRGFQASKKDEKKTLLSNMENGEDLY